MQTITEGQPKEPLREENGGYSPTFIQKTWKELREEKRQMKERRIRYFNPRPFASQPYQKNFKLQRRIEQNIQGQTMKDRERWGRTH